MKKKIKKKLKRKLRKIKKSTKKLRKKSKKIRIRRKVKTSKKRKKTRKKPKKRTNFRITVKSFKQAEFSKFEKQKQRLKKFTFQKIINFVMQPFFKAYDDFREKRKIERLRKIALERKEREMQIKE